MAKEEAENEAEKKEGGAEGAEGAEGGEGDAAAKKKKKKKIIIIAVIAAVLLIGGGVGAYLMLGKHAPKEGEAASGGEEAGKEGENKPAFYTMPEMLLNLNSGGKQSVFLKATVIMELAKPTDVPNVEANLPRLQDAFNTYLRDLRPSDLAGTAGIQRLREELLLRANKALSPVKINDILFKEIIVQ